MVIGTIELAASSWDNFNDDNRTMVIWPLLGGLSDGCSLYLYFVMLNLTDASIVVGVMYMYPAVVCLLSFIVLNEQLGVPGYLGVFILLAGAIILSINGIAKILAKCRPNAPILKGMDEGGKKKKKKKDDKDEDHDSRHKAPRVCWYPTPKRFYNFCCGCRDCDDPGDENDEYGVDMSDAKKWKRKEHGKDGEKLRKHKKKEVRQNTSCSCCNDCANENTSSSSDDGDGGETSEVSVSELSDAARPSMDGAVEEIRKDIGSDSYNSDYNSAPQIDVVVPTRSHHTPYSKRAAINAARRAAMIAASSTTEDSDSSAPASRHVAHTKKKKTKKPSLPPDIDSPRLQEESSAPSSPNPTPKTKRKPKKPAPKPVEDSDGEDDDADVDSGESSDDSDEEDNDEENVEKEGEQTENVQKTSGGGRKKSGKSENKRKKVKKGVEIPTVKDDDKIGESEFKKPIEKRQEQEDNKSLEEGRIQRRSQMRSHKQYVGRSYSPRRPFDLEDLSSTTDDVRSSMDERTDTDNAATLRTTRHKNRRYRLPDGTNRRPIETRKTSIDLQQKAAAQVRVKPKSKSGFTHSGEVKKSKDTGSHKSKGGVAGGMIPSVSTQSKAKESERETTEDEKDKEEDDEEEKEEKVLGCIRPGVLFAILAAPMVFFTGGYEFLIALGAKKGMYTFQVSGVEIITQGFTLTLGAWFTKEGRRCFLHELTWNWLFAFLNAGLTVCSQLLTVYSLTALPAAVSSSMCALQPLVILILETITSVTSFRVSQCLAFKLPPIILIVAGVALLSLDVLVA